jgi:SSS family solute:Na+ symporter
MNFLPFIIGYLALITGVALYFSRKVKSSDDFSIAGRRLGSIIIAGTLLATWMGGGSILGTANFIYTYGPFAGIVFCLAEPFGIFLLILLSRLIRRTESYTVAEILRRRYGNIANIMASLAIILAYVGIVSYQIRGFGIILNLSTGIKLESAFLISFMFILLITLVGGLISVAYTDCLSAFLIAFGLLAGIPFALQATQGFGGILSSLPAENLTLMSTLNPLQWIGYLLPVIFLVLGDQNMYQRLFAAKNECSAFRGSLYWLIGCLLINIPLIILATSSRALALLPLESADYAILELAARILPFALGGIVLASASAFLLTTGDSYLLSSATTFVYDILTKYRKRKTPDKLKLLLQRVMVLLLGIIAFIMIRFFPSVLEMQMFAYTIYGATITPALLGALIWKKSTKAGGISSMVVGICFTLIAQLTVKQWWNLNAVVVSAPLSILTLVVVSLLTQKKKSS